MIINDKRALAHVQVVTDIRPIAGADNIELIQVLGWFCIAKIGEFHVGDKAVYIEIDSKVPASDERFAFLERKGYKVKTYKLNKFGVVSQGLALPLSEFPELGDAEVGTDVTEALRIVYAIVEDNKRKADVNPLSVLKQRKPELFKRPIVKWLMKRKWGRKAILLVWGRKSDSKTTFPTHLCSRTDEERIENVPMFLGTGPYSATEKLDGSSATYAMERKGRKYEFYVCSRNVRQLNADQGCFYDDNIYWEQAIKYDIEAKLKAFLDVNKGIKSVVLQGEIVGPGVQKKTYGLTERDLFMFNMVVDGTSVDNMMLGAFCVANDLQHVPMLGVVQKLPEAMEEMKALAEGLSCIGNELREGVVYRGVDGAKGFKNVALSYLLEKHN